MPPEGKLVDGAQNYCLSYQLLGICYLSRASQAPNASVEQNIQA